MILTIELSYIANKIKGRLCVILGVLAPRKILKSRLNLRAISYYSITLVKYIGTALFDISKR